MILRKETETEFSIFKDGKIITIRMNDTPQGDGNSLLLKCR